MTRAWTEHDVDLLRDLLEEEEEDPLDDLLFLCFFVRDFVILWREKEADGRK